MKKNNLKKMMVAILVSFVFVGVLTNFNLNMIFQTKLIIIFVISMITSFYQADYNPMDFTTSKKDKWTMQQIIWTIYLSQFLALYEYFNWQVPTSISVEQWMALVFIMLGIFIRAQSYLTLGRFFTMEIKTHDQHEIIQSGPYQFLAHPSYTGAFLIYSLTPLFLGSLFSFLIFLPCLFFAFYRRIKYEEKMLIEEFGQKYQQFLSTRSKMIPYLW